MVGSVRCGEETGKEKQPVKRRRKRNCFRQEGRTDMEAKGISPELLESIRRFTKERNWDQFHNPKDMAISISLEAAELLGLFQWSGRDLDVAGKKSNMEEELADILTCSVMMAQVLGVEPERSMSNKLEQDIQQYPVEQAYGNAKKYTEQQACMNIRNGVTGKEDGCGEETG